MQQGLLFSLLTQGGGAAVKFFLLSSTKIVTGIARNSGWSRLSKNVSIARILNSIDQYQQSDFPLFQDLAFLSTMTVNEVAHFPNLKWLVPFSIKVQTNCTYSF